MDCEDEEAPPAYTTATTRTPTSTSPTNNTNNGGDNRDNSDGLMKCLSRMVKLLKSMGGLIILLLAYTFFGAWVMMIIEGPMEEAKKQKVFNVRETIAEELKVNTAALRNGSINDTEWEVRTSTMLEHLETTVHSTGLASTSTKKWTFFGAVLFCVTTYTTIGYGNIAPATTAGRIATMLYATIGIPLALIVLADLGRRFTIALKFVWSFIRRYYYTGHCRRLYKKSSKGSYDMNESKVGMDTGDGFDGGGGDVLNEGSYKNIRDRSEKDKGAYYKTESEVGHDDTGALLKKSDVLDVEKRIPEDCHTETSSLTASPRKEGDALDDTRRSQSADRTSNSHDSTQDCRSRVRQSESTAKKNSIFIDQAEFKEEFNLPVMVAVGFIFAYIFLGAGMYRLWENWTYLESFYFVFITTSTIGFGDILPEHPNFFLLSCIYTFLGLAVVSMTINVIMEWLTKTIDRAKEKVDEAKEKAVAKAKAAKGKLSEVGHRAKNKVLHKEESPSPKLKEKEDNKTENKQGASEDLKKINLDLPRDVHADQANGLYEKNGHRTDDTEATSGGTLRAPPGGGSADLLGAQEDVSELPTPSSDNEMSFRTANDFAGSNSTLS